MRKDNLYTCCFFGHRKVNQTNELICRLKKTIENLIVVKGVNIFLFGSKSDFDELCLKIVTDLKEKYPCIQRIYVRAEYADINDSYKNYLLESYDDTYYPERIRGAGRASYVERNFEMIDKSDFGVVYYNKNYVPSSGRNSTNALTDYQSKSGTKIAYDYAVKKGIEILNLFADNG